MSDVVNHPPHYNHGDIEPIDVIEDWQLNYHLGNVLRYIARAGHKEDSSLTDLKKARWYLDREIVRVETTIVEVFPMDVPPPRGSHAVSNAGRPQPLQTGDPGQ